MYDQPPFEPQDPYGVAGSLKEDDLRTPKRSSRPGSSFSPVPLFSLSTLKYEGDADEVPCKIKTNVDDPNLLSGMSSEEVLDKYKKRKAFMTPWPVHRFTHTHTHMCHKY